LWKAIFLGRNAIGVERSRLHFDELVAKAQELEAMGTLQFESFRAEQDLVQAQDFLKEVEKIQKAASEYAEEIAKNVAKIKRKLLNESRVIA
jgi:small-conductance mechanosensitive channel